MSNDTVLDEVYPIKTLNSYSVVSIILSNNRSYVRFENPLDSFYNLMLSKESLGNLIKDLSLIHEEMVEPCKSPLEEKEHLQWVYYRLQCAHGENPKVDYMQKLKGIILKYPTGDSNE